MERRDELLAACRRYFLRHGVANLSLRPLAAKVGTSARLLVYHFGSKEKLIAAVMESVRADLQAAFARADAAGDEHPALAFWRLLTAPRSLPAVRLLFEVQVLAIQDPQRYRRYVDDTSSTWLQAIEAALPAGPDRRAVATLYVAVVDGLLLELLATGDRARTTRALEAFLALQAAGRKGSGR
jgi:AcrR family transcriptional regulator